MKRLFGKFSTRRRSGNVGSSSQDPNSESSRSFNVERPHSQDLDPDSSRYSYSQVYDDKPHASDAQTVQRSQFRMRGSWKQVNIFYTQLSKYPKIKELIDRAGWSTLLAVKMPNSDQRLVESCIERWWDMTHTFHLPFVELGMTPYDFTFLTGISVGVGLPLPPYSDAAYSNAAATIAIYFPGAPFNTYYHGGIKLSGLKEYLSVAIAGLQNGLIMSSDVIARTFLLYTIGNLFFPNANSTVAPGWLAYVDDLTVVGNYDWGSTILARIYYGLDTCCRVQIKSMDCFWQFIEYFIAEYTHTSTPVLRQNTTDHWPRLMRWTSEERAPVTGSVRFKHSSHQQQLEMRSADAICWRSFISSEWNALATVARAFEISKRRILLWDPQLGGTWYLGDRCYRQLRGSIAIPYNPPSPMSKISSEDYERLLGVGWVEASVYIRLSTQAEWDQYWSTYSKGAVIPPLTRYVNTDGVGYAAVCPPHIRLPHPPDSGYKPSAYTTQEARGSNSQSSATLRPFTWDAEVAAQGGGSEIINIERPRQSRNPPAAVLTQEQWKDLYVDARDYAKSLRIVLMDQTRMREDMIAERDAEIARLQGLLATSGNASTAHFSPPPPPPPHTDYYQPDYRSTDIGGSSQSIFPHPGISQHLEEDAFNQLWGYRDN